MLALSLALVACSDTRRAGFIGDDTKPNAPPPRDAGAGVRDAAPPETFEGTSSNDASTTGEIGSTQRDDNIPKFSEVYLAIIKQRCAPCHTGTGDAATGITLGKLDMSTKEKAHANLVNVIAQGSECTTPWNYVRVSPGNPDKSVLWQKLSPDLQSCGKKMPADRAPLSTAELVVISDWIRAGAKDD